MKRKNIRFMDGTDKSMTIKHKCLPDTLEGFNHLFIDEDNDAVKNEPLLSNRIIGLTSYVGDLTHRMPRHSKEWMMSSKSRKLSLGGEFYEVVDVPMSLYQMKYYEIMRQYERKSESKRAKRALYQSTSSSYRIYSRLFCNFVFPEKDGELVRPFMHPPDQLKGVTESAADAEDANADAGADADANADEAKKEYLEKIEEAKRFLLKGASKYLGADALSEKYSPKFAQILERLQNSDYAGIHLLYSFFKSLEGIGIFAMVLDHHGFVELRVRRLDDGDYEVVVPSGISESDFFSRPWYVKYTGDQTNEEKEILRHASNSNWFVLPARVRESLEKKCLAQSKENNNFDGSVIKLFMITKSGAEGIDLKNVRYVHIMEPYWHPVRIEQVIGRARRIDSHINLDPKDRVIKVFLYLMVIAPENIDKLSPETNIYDRSKVDKTRIITTDESLYELMERKDRVNSHVKRIMKSTSFDCIIHTKESGVKCYTYGNATDGYAYNLDIGEERDDYLSVNMEERSINAVEVNIPDLDDPTKKVAYALDKTTGVLYNLDQYKVGVIVPVGKLIGNTVEYYV